ncbi:Fe-S protein assembly co-chaperone HscB [Ideonella sp. B7]|uniref:Fe-S protein assembly co-chaperone HscB n=1 Tax=Ideonella benzenivorans TaxID=2831643 RepID=UPI001CEDD3F6|nr:Fe-S protein assembly co-chaperone HscB [Ideonella benzenivorans]MCA6217425.1 Fe-S protein assembly co-chaperone HscB [Ideonella benzenivorans]
MNLQDDDFTLFGLPRQFHLDRAALDQRWRDLQTQVHPDRFAAEGPAAQRVAMQWAVRVNEAYRRLKDPLARGGYLCELAGAEVGAESNTAMPTSFLMQQMEWREALDEAGDVAAVEGLDHQVVAEEQRMLAELERLLDQAHDAAAAAQQVRALMFVNRFRADIDRRLEALDS